MQTNILLKDNDRHRKFTGVEKFHKAGYYGERVCAASGETWSLSSYNPDGLVYDVLDINSHSGINSHPVNTAATFFQVAPKAKLFMLYSSTGSYKGDGINYSNKFLEKSTKVIEENNITNMFVSLTGSRHKQYFTDLSKWLQEHSNFKYFWSAGNDSTEDYNKMLEIEEIIGVAAYTLMVNGKVAPAGYSSVTPYVDFSAPSMIYTNVNAESADDNGYPNTGTSFSAPWLCGMACLVDDFFIDTTGRPLSREAMVQFFKDHTVDIGDEGFDNKCGWGAVVLPDPSEIDIWKYQNKEEVLPTYKDTDQISAWAKDDVDYCYMQGIMQGDTSGKFRPKDNVTREELACVVARLHKQTK